MRTSAKLSAYGLTLAAVFTAAWTLGAAVGPLAPPATPTDHAHNHQAPDLGPAPSTEPTNGYHLDFEPTWPLAFRIISPTGTPITRFTTIHLTLTRLGAPGQPPLDATMTPDGTWHTPQTPAPGTYRLRADFTPEAGPHTVLTAGVQAPA